MQVQYTKNLNPGLSELGTTFGLLFRFSRKTWFKNRHFSDTEGDKRDTRFLFLSNGLFLVQVSCM